MAAFSRVRPTLLFVLVLAILLPALTAHAQDIPLDLQPTPDQIKAEKDKKETEEKRAAEEKKVKDRPECSLAKTNNNCRITIDRKNPVSPPAVQMYSDQTLTVIVKNPEKFERYFLDYQTGQAVLTPDIASSIVQGLLPAMSKFGEFNKAIEISPGQPVSPPPDPCTSSEITTLPKANTVASVVPAFQKCLGRLAIGLARQVMKKQ